ncbi:polyketide synthase dehydratase domain-containing protein, partial [Enterobacillus tribolii]
ALMRRAEQLSAHLSQQAVNLTDLAYTLQVGRDAMEHRLALTAESQEALVTQLRGVCDGTLTTGIWRGEVTSAPTENPAAGDALPQTLAQLWVEGFEIDWPKLYAGRQPNRLRLPTYPFARERYWFPENTTLAAGAGASLHPLVHRNISDIHAFCYDTLLTGQEWFLRDHQVMERAVLPGVAQLEWARAAVSLALGGEPDSADICLKKVVWLRQLAVAEWQKVCIELTPEDDGAMSWEIYGDEDGGEVVYSRGLAVQAVDSERPVFDTAPVAARCTEMAEGAQLYDQFARLGLNYGATMRTVQTLHGGEGIALASLASVDRRDGCQWSPALLDGALQAIAGTAREGEIALPFALREARSWSALPERPQVIVQKGTAHGASTPEWDITLVDDEGRAVMQLLGLAMRPVKPGAGLDTFPVQEN